MNDSSSDAYLALVLMPNSQANFLAFRLLEFFAMLVIPSSSKYNMD